MSTTSELIRSVNPVIPNKGKNAGRQMFVINGTLWARQEPNPNDTHVVINDVVAKNAAGVDTTYKNVVGYTKDTRLDINSKISMLKSAGAEFQTGVAMLLK